MAIVLLKPLNNTKYRKHIMAFCLIIIFQNNFLSISLLCMYHLLCGRLLIKAGVIEAKAKALAQRLEAKAKDFKKVQGQGQGRRGQGQGRGRQGQCQVVEAKAKAIFAMTSSENTG